MPVISYDRLIKGSDAVNYYISFDNEQVGKLQGQSLLTALGGKTNPHGRHDQRLADRQQRHAVQGRGAQRARRQGEHRQRVRHARLAPDKAQERDAAGADRAWATRWTACWRPTTARRWRHRGHEGAGLTPLPPVTGQDAELAAIQRILAGEQYMTVYKAIKPEAEAAATLAFALASGKTPDATTVNGKVNNGKMDVPSVLLVPVAVTKDNVGHSHRRRFLEGSARLHRRLCRGLHCRRDQVTK